ncbi:hypothetical protein MFLAVUS_009624 [Mucor flavus]|uniref:Borealin N-terminal domain-containing protein n=1 Tax=Mucor flavus TaxID=439312 RepID=A0ABP9ZAI2_9FUNG
MSFYSLLFQKENKRIEDIRQQTEFLCAALRAHGNAQLNKMLPSVRSLTLKEFCETYKADTQYYLQQSRKRLATKLPNEIKKRPKLIVNEKVPVQEPIYVHVEKEDHAKLSLRFDPESSIEQARKFKFNLATDTLSQLNNDQRARICDQIQDLQDQLESLKKNFFFSSPIE